MSGICGIVTSGQAGISPDYDFSRMFSGISEDAEQADKYIVNERGLCIGAVTDCSGDNRFGIAIDEGGALVCAIQGEYYLDASAGCDGGAGDVRSIIDAYRLHGERLPLHLTGSFNIVIADIEAGKSFVLNSRFGMLPLYYSVSGNSLAFSSSLASLVKGRKISSEINRNACIESAIFNYPLSDKSFIEGVDVLPSGSVLSFDGGASDVRAYWNVNELFHKPRYGRKDSIDLIDGTLRRLIGKYVSGRRMFGLSLTGGWDGRLILSYLRDVSEDGFFLYSFGAAGSADIEIPKRISSELGYNYTPYVLDENYLDKAFRKFSIDTITRSDGMRSYLRAHYLYTMWKLRGQTGIVLSGNCGSNLLKNVNSTGSVVSNSTFRLFRSDFSEDEICSLYEDFSQTGYMLLKHSDKDRFVESVRALKPDGDRDLTMNQKFYAFLLSVIERRYFGAEVASYPPGLINQSPFIDYEFVSTISETPYFGAHYRFFGRDPRDRGRLARLYAELITRHHPELAAYETDRGFSLTELASLSHLPKIIYKRYFSRNARSAHDNFNTELTDSLFYSIVKDSGIEDDLYNIKKLGVEISGGGKVRNRELFANCLSLAYWKNKAEL